MMMSPMISGLAMLAAAASLAAQDKPIDVKRSTITIHVGKAGMFSAAGHEHWVEAPIASGVLNESSAPRVEFKVETARMTVRRDPKVNDKDQAQIQKDMETMTLDTAKYPEIAFRSSRIEKLGEGEWKVEGTLSLHGATKPVSLIVKRNGDAYAGHVIIKQTDFGIKPVSVGGGMVKVKNEVDIDFQIFARAA
jgi:polyisoprenoid-binding protein YceI